MTPYNSFDTFSNKVKLASRSNAKDIRMPMTEAIELLADMNDLLLKNQSLLEQLRHSVQEQDVSFSGGNL